MHRVYLSLVFAVVLLIGVERPASSQVLPTGDPRALTDRALERQRQVRREALRETNELLRRWMEAWNRDDARRLADLYTEDAVLLPAGQGQQVRGVESIRSFLENAVEAAGEIDVILSDFDGTGRLAYALGKYSYPSGRPGSDNGPTRSVEGDVILVLRKDRGDWLIRSQLFQGGG